MIGKDITIGQYSRERTPLHRLDVRLKILAVLAGALLVFFYSSVYELLAFAGLLLALLLVCRVRILPVLRALRTVWVIVIITFLLQLFLSPGAIVWEWGFLSVTDAGITNGLILSLRIILLVVLLVALTMTTPPLTLADGLQSILSPLSLLRMPVERVTTVVSITLTFIPGILEQSHKLVKAQMARGADFESWNFLRRVKDLVPILVPLFVKIFHEAEELSLAMDARAYGGGTGRTRLHPLKIGFVQVVVTIAFIGGAVALKFVP